MKNWRTTLTGVLAALGATGAFLAFILSIPTPPWPQLFGASGAWCTAMSLAIGQIFGADAKAVTTALEQKADK